MLPRFLMPLAILISSAATAAVPTVTSVSPNYGNSAGGDVLSVQGTNFTTATAVHLQPSSGTPYSATFVIQSDTSIQVTTPASGAATFDVTVTNTDGTSETSMADHYTVLFPPGISSVSPNQGSTAGGTSVTITGSALTQTSAVNFGGTSATSFTVNSDTSITAIAPAGAGGTVDIQVVTPGGSSAAQAGDQYTYSAVPVRLQSFDVD